MTPENPVVGGTVLRIPAIQSPNFSLSGKTGWAIFSDGTAYFFDVNVAGTITGATIEGGTIEGADFLIYAATLTPVVNELVMSLARGTFTDSAGNETADGFSYYYLGSDGNYYVISLTNGTIQLSGTGAANEAGPWSQISNLFFDRTGVIRIVTPQGQIAGLNATLQVTAGAGVGGAGGSVAVLGPMTATSGTASSPTLITTDSWQNMTLQNGWSSAGAYARYRMLPDGNVQVQFQISGGTITNGTVIWTAPAGPPSYQPSTAPGIQYFPIIVASGASAAQADTPQYKMGTNGNLSVSFIPSGTTQIAGNFIYSLT